MSDEYPTPPSPRAVAQHWSPMIAQCAFRPWRATWTPDEWAGIFWTLVQIMPAMEIDGIDTSAIRQLCDLALTLPKGDYRLVSTSDELWQAASRAVTKFCNETLKSSLLPVANDRDKLHLLSEANESTGEVDHDDISKAIGIYTADTSLSDREVAKRAGIRHSSKLTRSDRYQRVKRTFAEGLPPRGIKDGNGNIEAFD